MAPLFDMVEMPTNPYELPLESTDPTVYYVPETTDQAQQVYTAGNPIPQSKAAAGKTQMSAKKLALRLAWSGELNEDSIIPLAETAQRQAIRAMQNAIDHVLVNGDTATGASVNVNLIDSTLYFGGTTRLPVIIASVATNVVTLTATMPGAIGNSYPLAKCGLNITISGATFTGGADRPASLTNYRAGNEVYDTAGDQWTGDQTPITGIIEDCVTSEYGAFFVQRDGTLTFYDRRWFFTPLTTALTLDSTSPFVLTLERNMEQVYNSVKTVIHPRATAGAVDVVAQIIKPVRIPPVSGAGAGSATITLHYRDALGNQVGATELVTPLVPYTDFTVKRDPNVYGDDYTVSPLFSFGVLDVRGSEIVIPVYSYETFPLYVNKLKVRGKAITTYDPVVFSADDASSQAAYLKRLLTIDLPLSADELFGNALATTYWIGTKRRLPIWTR